MLLDKWWQLKIHVFQNMTPCQLVNTITYTNYLTADPGGQPVWEVSLRLLVFWNCRFESRREHVFPSWELCVVSYRYLKLPDHTDHKSYEERRVFSMIMKPRQYDYEASSVWLWKLVSMIMKPRRWGQTLVHWTVTAIKRNYLANDAVTYEYEWIFKSSKKTRVRVFLCEIC